MLRRLCLGVGVIYVDVIGPETPQAVFHLFPDGASVQCLVNGHAVHIHFTAGTTDIMPPVSALGTDHHVLTVHPLERTPYDFLASAQTVDRCSIQGIDPCIQHLHDGLLCKSLVKLAPPLAAAHGKGSKSDNGTAYI